MRWLFLVAPLVVCHAQQLPADVLLIAKIKLKMMDNLGHLPNYTCAETIERGMRPASSKRFKARDTVRLEVAMVQGQEVYGWPGSNRVAESQLESLVGGTIGNGDFGLLAKSIFLSSGTSFKIAGSHSLDGQPALRVGYKMPLLSSGYRLRVPPNEAVVAYHGSVWVNPETLDLKRIELAADDIPEYLGLESSTKAIEYQRVPIGESDFLLPKSSELAMVDFHGIENRNRTTFHDCRQFSGESVLSFDDPPPDTPVTPVAQAEAIELPEHFGAKVSLLTPINSEIAAVGDPILAKLEEHVKAGHKVIAPKGAILSGRISELHQQEGLVELGFSLNALDFENRHADLSARENRIYIMAKAGITPLRSAFGHMYQHASYSTQPLVFEANRLKLPKGLLLYLQSRLLKSVK